MNFIQFIAPLIGGYWFLIKWNYTKFVVKEDSGYHLFFKSSIAGVGFLILVNLLLSSDVVAELAEFRAFSISIPSGFDFSSIAGMAVGFALPYILNCFYNETQGLEKAAQARGKYLFLLIKEAILNTQLVEVTLNKGKVYIGPVSRQMPIESEYLAVVPYLGGYIDDATRKLVITENYYNVIRPIVESEVGTRRSSLLLSFRVVVPAKDIASARLSNLEELKMRIRQQISIPSEHH